MCDQQLHLPCWALFRRVDPRDDPFDLFVLHKNRVRRGASDKNYVKEEDLPGFLDMVLWGHEHDCQADPVVWLPSL